MQIANFHPCMNGVKELTSSLILTAINIQIAYFIKLDDFFAWNQLLGIKAASSLTKFSPIQVLLVLLLHCIQFIYFGNV